MPNRKKRIRALATTGEDIMGAFEGPLPIPELDESITVVVRDFAKSHGLEYELWYHNEPLWLVLKREKGITRKVQVAAYAPLGGGTSQANLFFIPSAYSFDEQKLESRTIPGNVKEKYIRSKPTAEIPPNSKDVLVTMLDSAWKDAQKFSTADLTQFTGKIRAKA